MITTPACDKRPRQHARGQAAVELALSVPLLITLLLLVVETGRAFYIAISVSNAARAGVQYGAQNLTTATDNTGMQNAAIADAANVSGMTATASHYCQCSNGTASTCLSTDCAGSHRLMYAKVITSAVFTPITSWPGVLPSITIPGQAILRVAQ